MERESKTTETVEAEQAEQIEGENSDVLTTAKMELENESVLLPVVSARKSGCGRCG